MKYFISIFLLISIKSYAQKDLTTFSYGDKFLLKSIEQYIIDKDFVPSATSFFIANLYVSKYGKIDSISISKSVEKQLSLLVERSINNLKGFWKKSNKSNIITIPFFFILNNHNDDDNIALSKSKLLTSYNNQYSLNTVLTKPIIIFYGNDEKIY